jgi:3-isopropylmalate dehydrogenase
VFARAKGRPRVTLVDKANVMRHAGSLWRRVFAEVGEEFHEVERETVHVDSLAMDLVRRTERYAVIVTSNLFGDIVSDLAAELTGGLSLAPSADLHPGRHAMFGPVRGPAQELAGRGRANPFGAVRCVGLLLEHFGHAAAGERVEQAVAAAIAEGKTTPDMGGSFSTETVGAWLAQRVGGDAADENGTKT